MAGAFASVEIKGLAKVNQAINRLLRQGQNLDPALRDIGEFWLESTQQRFVDMQAPDGKPWEPLAPETLANKERPDRILTESGTLADTLNYQLSKGGLALGTNMEYGATHQFGRDDAGIPERPFLGLAAFEKLEVLDILRDHLDS